MKFDVLAAYVGVVSQTGLWFAEIFWQSCGMDERQEPVDEDLRQSRLRLGRIVEDRRKWLGYRQDNMPNGPSSTTMSAIENGQEVSELSYRRLEKSLGWAKHSVGKILSGADPETLDIDPAPSEPTPARLESLGVTVEDLQAMDVATRNLIAWEAAIAVLSNPTAHAVDIPSDSAVGVAIALAERFADGALESGAGAAAKPLLRRLFLDRQELEERGFENRSYWKRETGESNAVLTDPPAESDAQAPAVEDEEVTQGMVDLAARKVDDEDKPE